MDLKAKIADTRHKIEELKNTNSEYGKFISAIRRFMQMDNLTSPLLRELIDHIDILKQRAQAKVERNESLYITVLSDISNCRTPQNKTTLRTHAKGLP